MEKTLTQLIDEEEKFLNDVFKGKKWGPYNLMNFALKELFVMKSMLNEQRLFIQDKESLARIFVRVYLLTNVALVNLGYTGDMK